MQCAMQGGFMAFRFHFNTSPWEPISRHLNSSLDTVCITGLPKSVNLEEIRVFFTINEGPCRCFYVPGPGCCIGIRFNSPAVAQRVFFRYNNAYFAGYKIQVLPVSNGFIGYRNNCFRPNLMAQVEQDIQLQCDAYNRSILTYRRGNEVKDPINHRYLVQSTCTPSWQQKNYRSLVGRQNSIGPRSITKHSEIPPRGSTQQSVLGKKETFEENASHSKAGGKMGPKKRIVSPNGKTAEKNTKYAAKIPKLMSVKHIVFPDSQDLQDKKERIETRDEVYGKAREAKETKKTSLYDKKEFKKGSLDSSESESLQAEECLADKIPINPCSPSDLDNKESKVNSVTQTSIQKGVTSGLTACNIAEEAGKDEVGETNDNDNCFEQEYEKNLHHSPSNRLLEENPRNDSKKKFCRNGLKLRKTSDGSKLNSGITGNFCVETGSGVEELYKILEQTKIDREVLMNSEKSQIEVRRDSSAIRDELDKDALKKLQKNFVKVENGKEIPLNVQGKQKMEGISEDFQVDVKDKNKKETAVDVNGKQRSFKLTRRYMKKNKRKRLMRRLSKQNSTKDIDANSTIAITQTRKQEKNDFMRKLKLKKQEIEKEYERECATLLGMVSSLASKDPSLIEKLRGFVRDTLIELGNHLAEKFEAAMENV